MSSGAQHDLPAADRAARRSSFGRALERFKSAFTRRSSNKPGPSTGLDTPIAQSSVPAVSTAAATAADAGVAPTAPPAAGLAEASLEVDENAIDDFDDTEEPIIPVDAATRRSGISEDQARRLFENYGLKYPVAKRAQQEPPTKIRRVEKPVRIRLHWSCHHCKTAFAHDTVCSSCGHGRCGDCIRAPPQRVLRILEKTKRDMEAAEMRERAASAAPEDDVVPGPSSTMLAERVPVDIEAETPTATLPRTGDSKIETEPLRFVYTIRSGSLGGAGGLELYHMVSQKPFGRNVPNPSIQRVFKQPRQRVRWTCDRCEAVFLNRDTCSNCQHEKCGDCTRSPPKKDKPLIDPSVLRSVEARLAGPSAGFQSQLVAV